MVQQRRQPCDEGTVEFAEAGQERPQLFQGGQADAEIGPRRRVPAGEARQDGLHGWLAHVQQLLCGRLGSIIAHVQGLHQQGERLAVSFGGGRLAGAVLLVAQDHGREGEAGLGCQALQRVLRSGGQRRLVRGAYQEARDALADEDRGEDHLLDGAEADAIQDLGAAVGLGHGPEEHLPLGQGGGEHGVELHGDGDLANGLDVQVAVVDLQPAAQVAMAQDVEVQPAKVHEHAAPEGEQQGVAIPGSVHGSDGGVQGSRGAGLGGGQGSFTKGRVLLAVGGGRVDSGGNVIRGHGRQLRLQLGLLVEGGRARGVQLRLSGRFRLLGFERRFGRGSGGFGGK